MLTRARRGATQEDSVTTKLLACVLGLVSFGCASPWKVSGPEECVAMCKGWNMELSGMVGVGDQSSTGGGATACVCEMPAKASFKTGAAGISAGQAAAIVAIQEAERAAQQNAERPVQ
jgi:hypothetical protein